MIFRKVGGYLQIFIDGHEMRYLNNEIGFHLMAKAFCESRGIDL